MKCDKCNKKVTTPFCPTCGGKIDRGSPESLLGYIIEQKDRLVNSDKDAGRWIEWEQWVSSKIESNINDVDKENRGY
jgi:hypothetical protein